MITNIYEFYYDESGEPKDKSKLQEVTQVESSIDLEVNPTVTESIKDQEIELAPEVDLLTKEDTAEITLSDPNNQSDTKSINISQLTRESEDLGEVAAKVISSVIEPAIDVALNKIVDIVKTSNSDVKVATIIESTDINEIDPDPVPRILDQLQVDIEYLAAEALTEIIENGTQDQRNSVSQIVKLVQGNDIVKSTLDTYLKEQTYAIVNERLQDDIDDYENLGQFIKDEVNQMVTSLIDTSINTANLIMESVVKAGTNTIDAVLLDSWMIPTRGVMDMAEGAVSATGELIKSVTSSASGLVNGAKDVAKIVTRSATTEVLGRGIEWVHDNIMTPMEDAVIAARAAMRGAVSNLTNELKTPEVKLDNDVKIPLFMRNQWTYLRYISSNRSDNPYYRFSTTFDWLIRITPNTSGLPDLNSILGLGSQQYLPILNYSLTEAGLESSSYSFLSNTITIPQGYRRPSRLSITLPDMYVDKVMNNGKVSLNEGKTYLRYFKDEYIKYVKLPTEQSKIFSLSSRDYRDCCYRITLYRFPYIPTTESIVENFSFSKTYLGIPDIAISESGNDSKQVVIDTLNFNIVGEYE